MDPHGLVLLSAECCKGTGTEVQVISSANSQCGMISRADLQSFSLRDWSQQDWSIVLLAFAWRVFQMFPLFRQTTVPPTPVLLNCWSYRSTESISSCVMNLAMWFCGVLSCLVPEPVSFLHLDMAQKWANKGLTKKLVIFRKNEPVAAAAGAVRCWEWMGIQEWWGMRWWTSTYCRSVMVVEACSGSTPLKNIVCQIEENHLQDDGKMNENVKMFQSTNQTYNLWWLLKVITSFPTSK